jgi:hypothetical protein
MTEVPGEGSAELQDDGTIEIEFTYHDGDDGILKSRPRADFFNSLLGVKILGVALTVDDGWVVSAAGSAIGICPDCGRRSRSRHGWSRRSLQDLPAQGQSVTVKLLLSRAGDVHMGNAHDERSRTDCRR